MGNKGSRLNSDSSDSDTDDNNNNNKDVSTGSESVKTGSTSKNSMQSNMLRHRKLDVFKKYKVVQVLGNGSMGFVAKAKVRDKKVGGSAFTKKNILGINTKTSSSSLSERRTFDVLYALKSIQLDRVSPLFLDELRNEIDILKSLDHPNIVKAHEVYDYKKLIYIVLELCDGGDLYTRSPYSEKDSAGIIGKLLSAIKYMHDRGIVHRDLKYENIMFENHKPDAEIKVIDFGLSKKFVSGVEDDVMTEGVGTIYTMAPQVLQGVYTSQADLWSVGVIAYMLLSTHRPFHHKRRKIMIDKIMRVDYSLDKPYWEPISEEAKDMVRSLLVLDPKQRLTATQALQHVWLDKSFNLSDRKPDDVISKAVDESLIHFRNTSQLKKIALNVIAHKSSTDEILQLRKVFDQYDKSNDGIIEFDEFKEALKQTNYSEEEIQDLFDSIDVNQNGHIMYTEFLAATLEAHGRIEEERIADAFDRLDSDDSGYISKENLKEFLGDSVSDKDIKEIIASVDADNDGQISYKEFLALFRKKHISRVIEVAHLESTMSEKEGDASLVGLDAKIPGGKYDSTVDEKYKRAPPKL